MNYLQENLLIWFLLLTKVLILENSATTSRWVKIIIIWKIINHFQIGSWKGISRTPRPIWCIESCSKRKYWSNGKIIGQRKVLRTFEQNVLMNKMSAHTWASCEFKDLEHEKDNADLDKLSQTKQNLSNEVDQLRKISETLPEWCTSSWIWIPEDQVHSSSDGETNLNAIWAHFSIL